MKSLRTKKRDTGINRAALFCGVALSTSQYKPLLAVGNH